MRGVLLCVAECMVQLSMGCPGLHRLQGDAKLRSTFNDCTKVLLEEQASAGEGSRMLCVRKEQPCAYHSRDGCHA